MIFVQVNNPMMLAIYFLFGMIHIIVTSTAIIKLGAPSITLLRSSTVVVVKPLSTNGVRKAGLY